MEKYFNKVKPSSSNVDFISSPQSQVCFISSNVVFTPPNIVSTSPNVFIDIELMANLGLRKSIDKNMANIKNVRRAYLQKIHYQPKNHNLLWRDYGTMKRSFIPSWFKDHYNWLKYNISKYAAFCLFCYLFKADHKANGVVMHLLVKDSEIGGRKTGLMFMLETIIIIKTNARGLAKI